MAGDKPLPLRYVITTKSISGAPQYTFELRNWKNSPQIDAARFVFAPPQGAKQRWRLASLWRWTRYRTCFTVPGRQLLRPSSAVRLRQPVPWRGAAHDAAL